MNNLSFKIFSISLLILGAELKVIGQDLTFYLSDSLCKKTSWNSLTHYYPLQESKSGWTILYYNHESPVIYQKKRKLGHDTLITEGWYRDGVKSEEDSSNIQRLWEVGKHWYPNGNLQYWNHMVNDTLISHERFYKNGQIRQREIWNEKGKLVLSDPRNRQYPLYREYWSKNGQILSADSAYYNIKHHHLSYYPSGTKSSDCWYLGRTPCYIGKYFVWYESGVLSTEGQFKEWDIKQTQEHYSNYEYTGTWRYFDTEGKMVKTVIYDKELPKPTSQSVDSTAGMIVVPPRKFETFYFSGYTEKTDPFLFSQKQYLKSAMDILNDDE